MITRFRLFILGFAVVVLAIAAAGCNDDNGTGGGDVSARLDTIQTTLDELAESSQRSHVLATMTTVRAEGLHEVDGEALQASEIQAGWHGIIQRIRQAVGGTDWPDELSAEAAAWHDKLVAAEDAISSGDLAETKTAISFAHAAWHGIEPSAYQFAAGEEVTGGDMDMDMGNGDDETDMNMDSAGDDNAD